MSFYGAQRVKSARLKAQEDSRKLTNLQKDLIEQGTKTDDEYRLKVVKISELKGKGVVATKPIYKGEFFVCYRGTRLTEDQYKKRYRDGTNEYIFYNKSRKLIIDA